MIDRFFGIHQEFIRSGLCAKMKDGENRLYLFVMHKSERFSSLQITATDSEIRSAVGVAGRTLCNARKKLFEYGLICSRRGGGGRYTYTICNPETGKPYPGDPKVRVPYENRKRRAVQGEATPQPQRSATRSLLIERPEEYGMPMKF
jgi:DNA-binding transcriptional ArsR family regulator